jgi:hypothetical protein
VTSDALLDVFKAGLLLLTLVTGNAVIHHEHHQWLYQGQLIRSDIPVTGTAFDLAKNHMRSVGKEHIARNLVHAFPGNFLVAPVGFLDLTFFWADLDNPLMAAPAGVYSRHSCTRRVLIVGVTLDAFDIVLGMPRVIELNRLPIAAIRG